jgi:hypothetical protein
MGSIIKKLETRSTTKEKPRKLRFYFDTVSSRTFIKQSVALNMRNVAELSYPEIFHGLGNGEFFATHEGL